MQINLNLDKYREEELKVIFKNEKRPFTQTEVKRWFYDKIHYHALMG